MRRSELAHCWVLSEAHEKDAAAAALAVVQSIFARMRSGFAKQK